MGGGAIARRTRVTALMASSLTRSSTRTTSIQAIKAASPIIHIDLQNRVSPSPHHALKAAPAGAWRPAVRRAQMRPSRRQPDELRPVSLERGVVKFAEGSCFVKFGETHVLVTATLEDRLPPWLKGQGRGWITAEYGMLPRATLERTRREASAGKQSGRTV